MYELTIINIIIFFAAALQAITGFGFAVMATPLMLLIMNSTDCISIGIFLSLFMSTIMLPPIWRDIDWRLFKRLIIGSIVGAPVGLWLLMTLPVETIKFFVASLLVLVVGNGLLRNKKKVEKSANRRYEIAVGFGSGILTASLGMPGAPLAMYFSQRNTAKEQVRSTALAFYVGIYVVSVAMQAMVGQIASQAFTTSLSLIPSALIGTFCGCRLFCRVNQKYFSVLVNSIMLYTGLYIFWSMRL